MHAAYLPSERSETRKTQDLRSGLSVQHKTAIACVPQNRDQRMLFFARNLARLRVESGELNIAGTSRTSARERPAPSLPPSSSLYQPRPPRCQYPVCLLRYQQPSIERPRNLQLILEGKRYERVLSRGETLLLLLFQQQQQ